MEAAHCAIAYEKSMFDIMGWNYADENCKNVGR